MRRTMNAISTKSAAFITLVMMASMALGPLVITSDAGALATSCQ